MMIFLRFHSFIQEDDWVEIRHLTNWGETTWAEITLRHRTKLFKICEKET